MDLFGSLQNGKECKVFDHMADQTQKAALKKNMHAEQQVDASAKHTKTPSRCLVFRGSHRHSPCESSKTKFVDVILCCPVSRCREVRLVQVLVQ